MQKWQCRWASTLGELEATHQEVWGTDEYTDQERPAVFFGLYGLPDFYALWRHKGERHILWAGSDIRHFIKGYWLDGKGKIRLDPQAMAKWINKYCTSWVENYVEWKALKNVGIKSKICPSFLGDVRKYEVSWNIAFPRKFYTSVSGNEFKLYGWDKIEKLAKINSLTEFHLYGNTVEWPTKQKNIIVHGRVPKEKMNEEIKNMTGALRLTKFDGFSELLAKSVLWGQWPVSLIEYPHILKPKDIKIIDSFAHPNYGGREYYLKTLNNFPWNAKKHSTT